MQSTSATRIFVDLEMIEKPNPLSSYRYRGTVLSQRTGKQKWSNCGITRVTECDVHTTVLGTSSTEYPLSRAVWLPRSPDICTASTNQHIGSKARRHERYSNGATKSVRRYAHRLRRRCIRRP